MDNSPLIFSNRHSQKPDFKHMIQVKGMIIGISLIVLRSLQKIRFFFNEKIHDIYKFTFIK